MKKGFTIIEVVIAIGLFSILVAIAAGGYITALRTERQVSGIIGAQSNAGLALEQMLREVRTSYLFCHDPGSASPNATCNCTVSGATWICNALDFYNADTEHVNYALASGTLERTDSNQNGGLAEGITGGNVDVQSLQFILQGEIEGDHWNPRITILMTVSPSSTDPSLASDVIHLQTSVSAREIDCSSAGSC